MTDCRVGRSDSLGVGTYFESRFHNWMDNETNPIAINAYSMTAKSKKIFFSFIFIILSLLFASSGTRVFPGQK